MPALPADLHYTDDRQPCIRRRKLRGKFVYYDAQGQRLTQAAEVQRIKGVYFSIMTQALTFAGMLLFFRNETGMGRRKQRLIGGLSWKRQKSG